MAIPLEENVEKIVSASILSADFCNLGRDIKKAEDAGCKYIHFDVMDGIFVPNISFGIPLLKSVSKAAKGVVDVHLMITEPLRFVKEFASSGADIITFHAEAGSDIGETVEAIHSCEKKAGIAIKPKTDVSVVLPYLETADMILIMTVEPGFGGQGFMFETVEKISELKKIIDQKGLALPIEVDGGVNNETAKLVKEAGAEILVAGSYLFGAEDTREAVRNIIM